MAKNPYQQRRKGGSHFYEHRAVGELKVGRKLRPSEVVHHENGDPRDNHPDNIRVFKSQSHHMRYHHFLRREAQGVIHLFDVETWLEF